MPRSPKSLSPSPAANSSDKENPSRPGASSKGKGRAAMPTPLSSDGVSQGKRRRDTVTERNPRPPQKPRLSTETDEPEENESEGEDEPSNYYDPDQDAEQRRDNRKKYRELENLTRENRSEYSKSSNTDGIINVFQKANQYFQNVKQTSDATIDSRLLVTAADISYRQTCQVSLGDSVQGVDLDEFVSKCITFMNAGPGAAELSGSQHRSTQSNRRRRTHTDADGEDGDEGDELSWHILGQRACLRHNSRPSVPSFLLGPLSVEKKARKPIVRTARLKASQYTQTQPKILKEGDLDQDESKTLTHLTLMIHQRLKDVRRERQRRSDDAFQDGTSQADAKQILETNGLLYPRASLNLWQFVINPRSFGQTVENIFYVSFLIRDGKARLDPDDDGQIGLIEEEPGQNDEKRGKNSTKYQGIISIDMAEWSTLIELYDIRESMIQHRDDEEENVGRATSGWV